MGDKEIVIKTFKGTEVMPEERWESLIEDCKDIMVEHIHESREAIIKMKWELGDRLVEEGETVLSDGLVQRVGHELHVSRTDLYYCIQFRKKFPNLDELWEQAPEGKNISWHKLVNHYIDFTVPKPEVPVEETADTFGIIKWWAEQPELSVLKLTNTAFPFALIIKKEKDKGFSLTKPELKNVYRELGGFYVTLKKWDPKDLGRDDYQRMNCALKLLLEKAKYDKEKVKQAIKWCDSQYAGSKVDWTLETVVKKFPEAVRPVKEWEKYLKKK
jgi:hypothetical protein